MNLSDPLCFTLIVLLLAHLLGDFVLQPGSWVRRKEIRSWKSGTFYAHILLHGLLAWVLIAKCAFWPWAIVLMISHGLVDLLKIYAQKKARSAKRRWFWIDQLLHLLCLLLIGMGWVGQTSGGFVEVTKASWEAVSALWTLQHISLLTALVFLTWPSAICIRTLIAGWTPSYNNTLETDSLHNAGKYIGMLERLFVFAFVLTGHLEGVGFLLAAKSIFRFGDLKAARDRKLTEYVLIGTLLSFGFALLAGTLFLKFEIG